MNLKETITKNPKLKYSFEEYFEESEAGMSLDLQTVNQYDVERFYKLDISLQIGVLLNFFDTIGYDVTIVKYQSKSPCSDNKEGLDGTFTAFLHSEDGKWIYDVVDFETRSEAFIGAIEEIVNRYKV